MESPGIGIAVGLNAAPFGIGFNRKVDDQIIGRGPAGVPFQAFRYTSDSFRSSGYVLAMKLPKSLPTVCAFHADSPRPGVSGALVMLHVPREPAELALAVAWLERLQQNITSSPAMAFDGAPPPAHLSFQDRDHWIYRPSDDSMLRMVTHTTGGSGHAAKDIIVSENQGIPFIRLTHTWQTTTTSTDSNGNTTTQTQHHSEDITEFRTTFPFRELSVNWGMGKGFGGNRVQFESAAFNQMFKVRCPVPRFASDVFHPRQLEYFLRTGGIGFSVGANGTIRVEGGTWSPAELDRTSEFLHGFFSRIPDFTWQELGARPRPTAGPSS